MLAQWRKAAGRAPTTFVAMASLAFLLLCGQPALAKRFHFDPASCKHDTGHMYIALGRAVIAVPTPKQAAMLLDPLQPDASHLKAPDPAEPVGCFGNPLQSGGFGLFWSNSLTSNAPGDRKLGVPDRVRLLKTFTEPGDPDGEWDIENMERDIAKEMCRRAAVTEVLSNDLVACRMKQTLPGVPEIDWAASYTAKKGTYTTPDGRPFVVNCGPDLFSSGVDDCTVDYQLTKDVGLNYEFRPYLGSDPIPITRIISFDKSLRAIVDRAVVKGYAWPK